MKLTEAEMRIVCILVTQNGDPVRLTSELCHVLAGVLVAFHDGILCAQINTHRGDCQTPLHGEAGNSVASELKRLVYGRCRPLPSSSRARWRSSGTERARWQPLWWTQGRIR